MDGRRNIQPSARSSIHDNCENCRCRETMGRYGVDNKKREFNLPAQGVDDVDNVMSKMSPARSCITTSRHKLSKRHSLDNSNESDDDSPDDERWNTEAESTYESVHDRSDGTSYNHSNLSRHESSYETSQNLGTESNNSSKSFYIIILSILVCGLGVMYYNYVSNESEENDVYDQFSFYNDVKDIGEKYKVLDDSILQVKTGISTIFENQDSGSFIFTYDSNANNYNPLKLDQFLEDISSKSSKYLRNETKQVQPVVVNLSNQLVHTEKEFMNLYQSEVDKWGVMLVKDVDNIPSHLAMAFHYYCDEYNPLVKKSAIFFTLNLAKCTNGSNRRSTHDYVEKCLARKWNSVEQDKIGPLLTRVVNVVIDVTSIW